MSGVEVFLLVLVALLVCAVVFGWYEIFALTQRLERFRAAVSEDVRAFLRAAEPHVFQPVPPPRSEAEKLADFRRRLLVALGEDPSNPDSVDPLVLVETMRAQHRELLAAQATAPAPRRRGRKPKAQAQPEQAPAQAIQVDLVAVAAAAAEQTGGVA